MVDSLVASSLAAESGAPIVLGDTNSALAAVDVHAKLPATAVVTALGGNTVVPDVVLTGVATGVVEPPTAVTQSILIKGFAFSPAELIVNKGDTVTWTNEDSVVHNVVGGILHSQDLANGQSFSFTFTETGTYDYICTHHSSMNGKITVK